MCIYISASAFCQGCKQPLKYCWQPLQKQIINKNYKNFVIKFIVLSSIDCRSYNRLENTFNFSSILYFTFCL